MVVFLELTFPEELIHIVGLGIIQILYLLIHLILMVGITTCKLQMEWDV